MKRIGIAGWLTILLATSAFAQSGDTDAPEARRNWYNDPFIALSRDVAECPLPPGPWTTRAEMADDAHYRAERVSPRWLAHPFTQPKSSMSALALLPIYIRPTATPPISRSYHSFLH